MTLLPRPLMPSLSKTLFFRTLHVLDTLLTVLEPPRTRNELSNCCETTKTNEPVNSPRIAWEHFFEQRERSRNCRVSLRKLDVPVIRLCQVGSMKKRCIG